MISDTSDLALTVLLSLVKERNAPARATRPFPAIRKTRPLGAQRNPRSCLGQLNHAGCADGQ